MCTVLRCSGPKSVAALRSLVAASWVGVEPIAMLKSTAQRVAAPRQCGVSVRVSAASVEAGAEGGGGA